MNKIAIIFDFDDTLAPDSTSSFLEFIGVDVHDFWHNKVQSLDDDDWDPIPAYLYQMIKISGKGKTPLISKELFEIFAAGLQFYKGVEKVFKTLEKHSKQINKNIELEYYLISSGIGDIIRNTTIAHNFTEIWASEFHYNSEGGIDFPKKIISFTDKTRYIFQINKGIIGDKFRGKPFEVNKKVNKEQLRIQPENMIIVGDGYTDIPCFSLIRSYGGIAIGVYDNKNKKKWGKAWGFIEDGRVSNLVSANYSANSDLMNTLIMAVDSIARKISMSSNIYQG